MEPARSRPGGLAVHTVGTGSPVVLLHGLGGASSNWADVAPRLARNHRVVALDLPGHGASKPLRGAGLAEFADAVAREIESAEAAPALVVGHSFGGHVAGALAAARPQLVRGLLLVAPAGIYTLTRAARLGVQASTVVRPGRFVAPLAPRLADRIWFRRAVLRPWLVSDPAGLSGRATLGFFSELRRHLDTRTAGRAMVADDARLALERIGCPAIVLWGARDRQLPLEDGFEYARRLRAGLRIVADCGHLVIGERPEAVVDAVAALDRACTGG